MKNKIAILALVSMSSSAFAGVMTTKVTGVKAQRIASALIAGKIGTYVAVGNKNWLTYDSTKNYVKVGAISCVSSVLVHPTESSVIDDASCTKIVKKSTVKIANGLALVLALENADLTSGNNGPSLVNPWQTNYDLNSIVCRSIIGQGETSCKVVMNVDDEQ